MFNSEEITVQEEKYISLFFNPNKIFIPNKVYRRLFRATKKQLSSIDKDKIKAIEKCLIVVSQLNSTNFTKNKNDRYKCLHSSILHDLTKESDTHYLYIKILNILKKTGIIKVMLNDKGQESYEQGKYSKMYALTDTYYQKGLSSYTITNKELIQQRMRYFYSQCVNLRKNTIANNLLDIYPLISFPAVKDILTEGKRLAKEGYVTKKGFKLTFRGKNVDSNWKDINNRVFIETHIEQFRYLTENGFILPIIGSDNSGNRIIDSITLMPSWIRNLVKYNGQPLIELDYSCLHPNIAKLLYGGLPSTITHDMVAKYLDIPLHLAKIEHLSFFNKEVLQMMKSPLYKYYLDNEPTMLANILKEKNVFGYKITSKKLFKKEVELMTNVIREINNNDIRVLYVYDALMCAAEEKYLIQNIMQSEAFKLNLSLKVK
jgi:hypothetical protein